MEIALSEMSPGNEKAMVLSVQTVIILSSVFEKNIDRHKILCYNEAVILRYHIIFCGIYIISQN